MTTQPDYKLWYDLMLIAYGSELILPQNRAPLLPPGAVELGYYQGPHDARCWVGTLNGDRVLAFQGTQPAELESDLANLDTSPIPLPHSFGELVVAGYWNQLQDLLPLLAGQAPFKYIIGHSMGGGIATQYRRVYAVGDPILITFGAVKSGNSVFYTSPSLINSVRIVNYKDPAPDWPLAWEGILIPMQWLNNGTVSLLTPLHPTFPVQRPVICFPWDLLKYHLPGQYIGSLGALPGAI